MQTYGAKTTASEATRFSATRWQKKNQSQCHNVNRGMVPVLGRGVCGNSYIDPSQQKCM